VVRGMIDIDPINHAIFAAQLGDREAWTKIYCAYDPALQSARWPNIREDDWRDLVADVWLKAFVSLPGLTPDICEGIRFKAWLRMVLDNRATDFYRRKRYQAERLETSLERRRDGEPMRIVSLIDATQASPDDTEAIVIDREAAWQVCDRLARAAEKADRAYPSAAEAYALYRSGLQQRQCAARLGLSMAAVKARLARHRKVLLQEWQVEARVDGWDIGNG
jgi:RNA polymerase sigma factor (sigma-70 family)